jgi:uncharacterized protein (TIGR02246 family)
MTTDIDVPGLDSLAPDDQAAVGNTLGRLLRGFQTRNADALDGDYADDADWVNAFGTVRKGSAAIVEYLRGLFADANFSAGRPAGPPELSVRRVGDDGVVVSVHLRILGQGRVGGGEIAVRDNFSLHVLQRGADGRWPIVSEMYMDAREDETYVAEDGR